MYKNKKIIAIVPARKSNDTIEELNLKHLGDRPLISYTLESAVKSSLIDKVYLSTEDEGISDLASEYDIEVPFLRPLELTKKTVTAREVAAHMLSQLSEDFDVVIILMPNAPFRGSNIIDEGIRFTIDNNYEKIRGVSKLKDYFLSEIEIKGENNSNLIRGANTPQLVERTVVAGGVYIYQTSRLLLKNDTLPFENYFIPRHESTLIKSLYDLLIAERLVNLNNLLIASLIEST